MVSSTGTKKQSPSSLTPTPSEKSPDGAAKTGGAVAPTKTEAAQKPDEHAEEFKVPEGVQDAVGFAKAVWDMTPAGQMIELGDAARHLIVDLASGPSPAAALLAVNDDIAAMKPGDTIELSRSAVGNKLFGGVAGVEDNAKITITRTERGWSVKNEGGGGGNVTASGGSISKARISATVDGSSSVEFTDVGKAQSYVDKMIAVEGALPQTIAQPLAAAIGKDQGTLTSVGLKFKVGGEGSLDLVKGKLEAFDVATDNKLGVSLKAAQDVGARIDAGPPAAIVMTATFSGEAAATATRGLVSGVASPANIKGKGSVAVELSYPLPPGMTLEDALKHPAEAIEKAQSPGVMSATVKAEVGASDGKVMVSELKLKEGEGGAMKVKSLKSTVFQQDTNALDVKEDLVEGKLSYVERGNSVQTVWDGKESADAFLKKTTGLFLESQRIDALRSGGGR